MWFGSVRFDNFTLKSQAVKPNQTKPHFQTEPRRFKSVHTVSVWNSERRDKSALLHYGIIEPNEMVWLSVDRDFFSLPNKYLTLDYLGFSRSKNSIWNYILCIFLYSQLFLLSAYTFNLPSLHLCTYLFLKSIVKLLPENFSSSQNWHWW